MYNLLAVFSFLLNIGMILGGIMAYRHGFAKTASEIYERVVIMYEAELKEIRTQLEEVKTENVRLHSIYNIIVTALGKRGIVISVSGELVHIVDQAAGYAHIGRIVENWFKE